MWGEIWTTWRHLEYTEVTTHFLHDIVGENDRYKVLNSSHRGVEVPSHMILHCKYTFMCVWVVGGNLKDVTVILYIITIRFTMNSYFRISVRFTLNSYSIISIRFTLNSYSRITIRFTLNSYSIITIRFTLNSYSWITAVFVYLE